jgi:cupin fold WbuC family metalloprotein
MTALSIKDPALVRADPQARSTSYFTRAGGGLVTRALCDELRAEAMAQGGNARLSLHAGPDDVLYQMLIAQHAHHYNRPKKHPGRAKSWHLIEGRMAVIVFDDQGRVTERVVLDERESFLHRLPTDTYHTNVPLTPLVVHIETLPGPFIDGQDRRQAAFAPDGTDSDLAASYILGLVRDLLPNDSVRRESS